MTPPDTTNLTTSAEQAMKEADQAIAHYESQLRQLRAFRTACQQVIQNGRRVEAEGEGTQTESWSETLARLPQTDSEAA